MSPDPRAVIFDLDDTLYPYRRFRLSGFAAVAGRLERDYGVDPTHAFRLLVHASRGPQQGQELQACLRAFELAPEALSALIEVIRVHTPRLRLPRAAQEMLRLLRSHGWRTGVLTNGPPLIQARKVAALAVANCVDAVVYARAHGSGAGKPEPEPFQAIARRLGVSPGRSVVVGDDERCDIAGAYAAGMIPVRCLAWTSPFGSTTARAVAHQLSDIPDIVQALVEEDRHEAA
jgi:putative hydrolase of the HAD superfamily